MTASFAFSGSQSPWSDGALAQSSPGTTNLGASGIFQNGASTSNRIGLAGIAFNPDRSIEIQGVGSRMAWADSALSSSIYIDYVDETHYIRVRGYQPNTNKNVFRIYRANGGAEAAVYTSPTLTDAEVDGAHTLRASAAVTGSDTLISIFWDDEIHGSHLVTAWTPSGDPLLGLERGATSSNYLTVSALTFTGEIAGPSIGPISTDDTVTQGETGITFRISGMTSAPTSVTLNGISLAFTTELVVGGEGDIDVTLTDPIPLDLAEGNYNFVVSNAEESATKSAGYVVTHPIALPDPGEYDSNSILAGLGTSFPAGSFANLPMVFVGEESITPTFKAPYTGWHDADLTLSIDDILEAPEGVTGEFSATAEALFPDGTSDTWVIGLEIAEPGLTLSVELVGGDDLPYASSSIDWFLSETWGGAPFASGTVSTDSSGVLTLTEIDAEEGGAWLHYRATGDYDLAAAVPVTLEQ